MNNVAKSYETLVDGDSLTDIELMTLYHAFKDAYDACSILGPRFAVAANEARHRLDQVKKYLYVRHGGLIN